MPADPSHPFATFPAAPGKGLRPYYTPGLLNTDSSNYTPFVTTAAPNNTAVPYYATDQDDLIDSRAAARELVNFTVLKYITTAVSCPFDVATTLLQVQYLPHEDAEVVSSKGQEEEVPVPFYENTNEHRAPTEPLCEQYRKNILIWTLKKKRKRMIFMEPTGNSSSQHRRRPWTPTTQSLSKRYLWTRTAT